MTNNKYSKDYVPEKKRKKPKKFLPAWAVILRNIVLFTIVSAVMLYGLIGANFTKFYNEKDFLRFAEITETFEEYEQRGVKVYDHVITIEKISERYQYAGALIDLSKLEREDATFGNVRINYNAISSQQQLEHILFINATYPISGTKDLWGDVKVYIDDEHLAVASDLGSAEEFYAIQEEYEKTHANLIEILKNDYEHLLYKIFHSNTWIMFAVLILGGIYLLVKRNDRYWVNENVSIKVALWYYSSMAVTLLGCLALGLLGETMYNEGGIPGLMFKATVVITVIGAVLFLTSLFVPMIIDRDFAFGFSLFWWKIVLAVIIGAIGFWVGVVIMEIMGVYRVVQTVLMIALLIALFYAFFIVVAILGERSVIFRTYMDVSFAVTGAVAEAAVAYYDSIDWEATRKKREKIAREIEDILNDDGT